MEAVVVAVAAVGVVAVVAVVGGANRSYTVSHSEQNNPIMGHVYGYCCDCCCSCCVVVIVAAVAVVVAAVAVKRHMVAIIKCDRDGG